jgi:hypothetical protein
MNSSRTVNMMKLFYDRLRLEQNAWFFSIFGTTICCSRFGCNALLVLVAICRQLWVMSSASWNIWRQNSSNTITKMIDTINSECDDDWALICLTSLYQLSWLLEVGSSVGALICPDCDFRHASTDCSIVWERALPYTGPFAADFCKGSGQSTIRWHCPLCIDSIIWDFHFNMSKIRVILVIIRSKSRVELLKMLLQLRRYFLCRAIFQWFHGSFPRRVK